MRYRGQAYELTVEIGRDGAFGGVREAFDVLHEARFAHHDAAAAVEVVSVRATARIAGIDADPTPRFERGDAAVETAAVWFAGERRETRFIDRAGLVPGDRIEGPAILTQLDSTTLVAPGWRAEVDAAGNLILQRSGTEQS